MTDIRLRQNPKEKASVPAFTGQAHTISFILIPRSSNLTTVNYDNDGSQAPYPYSINCGNKIKLMV